MEQTKVAKKRPREESSSSRPSEGPAQRMAPEAPGACAEPPVVVTSDCHLHEAPPRKESAHTSHTPSTQQPVPNSASVQVHSLPVAEAVAIVQDSVKHTEEESDDVEELLMRALEEELETPNVFQNVEEDDNYDESEDDEE